MLTSTISRKAAPSRSQKLAFGNAQASGRLATAAPPPPTGCPTSGGNPSPMGGEAVEGALALDGSVCWKAAAGISPAGGPKEPLGGTGEAGGAGSVEGAGAVGFGGASRRKPANAAMTAAPKPQTLVIASVSMPTM